MILFRKNNFEFNIFSILCILSLVFFIFFVTFPASAMQVSDTVTDTFFDTVSETGSQNYYTWKCDNSRSGYVSENGPSSPFILWKEGFKEEGNFPPLVDGSPIYVDGKVYFSVWNGGSPAPFNALYCYDANTGERIWKNDGGQFRAGPTYFAERLYIGDLSGSLHCIDDLSGETVWVTESLSQTPWAGLSSTPLVIETEDDSILIFVVGSKEYPYGNGEDDSIAVLKDTLYVFEDTGRSYKLIDSVRPDVSKQSGSYMYASASSSPDGVVFVPGAGGVFAYDYKSKEILWSFDAKAYGPMGSGMGSVFIGGNDICVSTPVYSDGNVYFCRNNSVFCVDAKDGTEIWRNTRDKYSKWSLNPVTPCVTEDKVLVTADGLNCYDKFTGELIWRYEDGGPMSTVRSSPIVAGDYAYFGTYSSGTLYSVKISDGSLNWKYVFPEIEAGWYSLIEATPLVRGGHLYVGSEDGFFYTFKDPLYSIDYELYDSNSSSNPNLTPNRIHVNSDGVLNEGDSVYLPDPFLLERNKSKDFVFSGWYTNYENGKKIGNPGDMYVLNDNVTLFGKWNKDIVENISVTYKSGDGTNEIIFIETVSLSESPEMDVYFKKEGYAHSGWTFNGKPVSSDFSPEFDCTLYPLLSKLPDINGDSETNILDTILFLQYVSGIGAYADISEFEMIESGFDLDGDGKISIVDVILYLKSI